MMAMGNVDTFGIPSTLNNVIQLSLYELEKTNLLNSFHIDSLLVLTLVFDLPRPVPIRIVTAEVSLCSSSVEKFNTAAGADLGIL